MSYNEIVILAQVLSLFFGFSVHKLTKIEQAQYISAILTEQAWPIKDLLHGFH